MAGPQNQGVPTQALPIADPSTGRINPIWLQFLTTLWQRTGGATNSGNVQSINVQGEDGIIANVVNSTSNPEVVLSLSDITPQSVASSGPVSGTTGSFPTGLSTQGSMQFGFLTLGGLSQIGYITITDASGNTQKIMVGS